MRLTAEVIAGAPVYMNPLKQREMNLRGLKIPQIENLGVTNDEYEVIDLSDNELTRLDHLPLLQRLNTLLLSHNRIGKIALDLQRNVPKLEALILTHNRLATLADLDALACLTSLRTLSLLHNPCTTLANYRAYVIHLLPQLTSLDFAKVKPKERDAALLMFGPPPTLAQLQQAVVDAAAAANEPAQPEKPLPGQAVPQGQLVSLNTYASPSTAAAAPKLSAEELSTEKKRLVGLIAAATNIDEVNALQKQLETLIAQHAS